MTGHTVWYIYPRFPRTHCYITALPTSEYLHRQTLHCWFVLCPNTDRQTDRLVFRNTRVYYTEIIPACRMFMLKSGCCVKDLLSRILIINPCLCIQHSREHLHPPYVSHTAVFRWFISFSGADFLFIQDTCDIFLFKLFFFANRFINRG